MFLFGDRNIPNLDNTTSIYNSTSGSTIPSKINSCLIWGRWIHVWTYLNLYKWVWRNQHDQVIKWLWLSWLRSSFHLQKTDSYHPLPKSAMWVILHLVFYLGFKVSSKKASSSDPEVGKRQFFCLNQYQLLTFEKETHIYTWSLEGKGSSQVLINMILSRRTRWLICGQPKKNF